MSSQKPLKFYSIRGFNESCVPGNSALLEQESLEPGMDSGGSGTFIPGYRHYRDSTGMELGSVLVVVSYHWAWVPLPSVPTIFRTGHAHLNCPDRLWTFAQLLELSTLF